MFSPQMLHAERVIVQACELTCEKSDEDQTRVRRGQSEATTTTTTQTRDGLFSLDFHTPLQPAAAPQLPGPGQGRQARHSTKKEDHTIHISFARRSKLRAIGWKASLCASYVLTVA
jgi:hypothetical protein